MKKQLLLVVGLVCVAQGALQAWENRGGSSQEVSVKNATNIPIKVALSERFRTDDTHLLQPGESRQLFSKEKGARGIYVKSGVDSHGDNMTIKGSSYKLNANKSYAATITLKQDENNQNKQHLVISVKETGNKQ
jgi:hypothetical protein